jgi:hypothetical protein
VAIACRKVFNRAAVAHCKRNILRKIRTQGNCGLRKELTAAGRKMTRYAGHRRKGKNKDDDAPRSPKGRTFGKRRWKGPECNSGIRDKGFRQELRGSKGMKYLGDRRPLYPRKKGTTTDGIGGWSSGERSNLKSGRTLRKTLYEIFGSKIAKQMVETSIRMRKMRN